MRITQLLTEFSSSPLLLRESAQQGVEVMLSKAIQNQNKNQAETVNFNFQSMHEKMISADRINSSDPFDDFEENSVVIFPIIGLMSKYNMFDYDSYRWIIGMDIIAGLLRQADASPKIAGTVILCNTPGGSTQSIYQLEIALRNRTKPCIGLVDGMCMSGGIYTLSFCDKIFAVHPMCEVGSIGTFSRIIDNSELYEKNGIKIISVYPPESKYKNLAVREAIEGKPERLIDEHLTPFAKHFQNIITTNRPKLDTSVEGIIEGGEFYAVDAVKHNLIDGIMTIDEAIQEVHNLKKEQNLIYSSFKN